jgi:DNA polymerase-1
MRSVLVGQVHDSTLGDVAEDELDEYLKIVKHVMVDRLREHWSWIIVPLAIECKVGQNWYDMEKV